MFLHAHRHLFTTVAAYLETIDLITGHITRDAYFQGCHVFSPLLFGLFALILAC